MALSGSEWLDAQYAVIGAALIEPKLVDRILAETRETDYTGACKSVYEAMRDIRQEGQPADVVTIAARLSKEHKAFLAELMEVTPTAAHVDAYIGVCREQAKLAALRSLGVQLSGVEALSDATPMLTAANGLMADRQSLRAAGMADCLKSFFARHTGDKTYLPWPITALTDNLFVEPGDLVVLGGYPSAGKSALALQCAWLWGSNYRVGIYSLETSEGKLFDRLAALTTGIDMSRIKRNQLTDADWTEITAASAEISARSIEIIPAAGMSVSEIQAIATNRGHEIVIVDYLQILRGEGKSRVEAVTNISMALHTMSQATGKIVVALSQLSRKGDDAAPTMTSLRESGQIEQDADVVMLLYLEDERKPNGPRLLRIAKNKEGQRPGVKLEFDGAHQIFYRSAGNLAEPKPRRRQPPPAQASMYDLPDDTPVPF